MHICIPPAHFAPHALPCLSALPRCAAKLVARGRQLVAMYEEVGVGKDRVLLRMPATWAAIQAGKQLEVEGIACHLVLVYRWVVRKLEWVGGWAGRWES